VRTLVVSDLHLGGRLEHAVLARVEPRRHLLAAIDSVERLVLLGDTLELLEGRPQQALQIAEPIVRAIGARVGPDREVILVPGNHDAQLLRGWVRRQGRALQPDTEVPLDATPALARVTSWLAPARVRVHYPGVWLSERIWATHGHYLDHHLMPVSAWGFARGLLGRPPRDDALPIDYEHSSRPSLARFTRWLPRALATLIDDAAELARAATMPAIPALQQRLLQPRWAPLTSMLLGFQMRRASIPALARVVHRLGVDAEWVIFGHVHRLGPLSSDDPDQWRGPGGRPQIVNTGSWQYEPLLVHRATPPHPYWPGGAALLDGGDAEPRALGLLDDLAEHLLH
jgi:UDP-2,3-diacylglucosamine pyrophosphatase LpxH